MMKTILAATIAIACMLPSATFAGDKEWATAGKILTGVVGLQFLQSAHKSSHHRHYQSRSCRPAPRSYPHRHHHTTTIERTIVHGADCACSTCRPVVRQTETRTTTRIYHGTVPRCGNPVILEVNSTRRIFQPRIKGHVAYLQVYDQGEWLTLREYPSVY